MEGKSSGASPSQSINRQVPLAGHFRSFLCTSQDTNSGEARSSEDGVLRSFQRRTIRPNLVSRSLVLFPGAARRASSTTNPKPSRIQKPEARSQERASRAGWRPILNSEFSIFYFLFFPLPRYFALVGLKPSAFCTPSSNSTGKGRRPIQPTCPSGRTSAAAPPATFQALQSEPFVDPSR